MIKASELKKITEEYKNIYNNNNIKYWIIQQIFENIFEGHTEIILDSDCYESEEVKSFIEEVEQAIEYYRSLGYKITNKEWDEDESIFYFNIAWI